MSEGFAVVSPEEARQVPYPYVYVEANGSVRELHANERAYLEELFSPGDGNFPYVKHAYETKDGWGNIAGYCLRSAIPQNLKIGEAPAEDPHPPIPVEEYVARMKELLAKGDAKPTVRRPWWKFWG